IGTMKLVPYVSPQDLEFQNPSSALYPLEEVGYPKTLASVVGKNQFDPGYRSMDNCFVMSTYTRELSTPEGSPPERSI
ncbi:unnamed protein product, partial [Allacma fusca]